MEIFRKTIRILALATLESIAFPHVAFLLQLKKF